VILDLEPRPQAVRDARALVSALLTPSLPGEVVETAKLLLSEVVTDAIRHTHTRTTTRLVLDGSMLRVEVYDDGAGTIVAPEPAQSVPFREVGIGLFIVDRLADRWGIEAHEVGKCVWFELDVG
jgi:anti-sigma regulatory factor (Ser/Thr protein kinase)